MRLETRGLLAAREPWPLRWGVGLARAATTVLLLLLVVLSFLLLGLLNLLQAWGNKHAS